MTYNLLMAMQGYADDPEIMQNNKPPEDSPIAPPDLFCQFKLSFASYPPSSAGKSICQRELEVHCQRGHLQGLPGHSEVLYFPEDDC